jgi:hypothetical protein
MAVLKILLIANVQIILNNGLAVVCSFHQNNKASCSAIEASEMGNISKDDEILICAINQSINQSNKPSKALLC